MLHLSPTCPRNDQFSSATTEREHQKATGLPEEDHLPGDEPHGRGRPTQRLRLPTPEWRRRRRRRRLCHSWGRPATTWKHVIWPACRSLV
eukprot:999965-Pyramimonas_sp.AAC.1